MQEYGSMTVMALTGDLKLGAAERSSGFHRDKERTRPYRYDVVLDDYGIEASLTGTARAGFLRFQFDRGGTAWLLVEANARPGEGSIHIDRERREIYGANPVHRIYAGSGQPAGFSGFFVARFDRPFQTQGTWSAPGAYLSWPMAAGETVLVKIGTSFTSVEEARRNLDAEIPDWDFAKTADEARRSWNEALSRIEIGGAAESRRADLLHGALPCLTAAAHLQRRRRKLPDVRRAGPHSHGERLHLLLRLFVVGHVPRLASRC